MAKLIIIAALIAVAFAAEPLNGRDILGNFYDGTTGQISSSLTGRVYNTAGRVYGAPLVQAAYAAPIATYAAPIHAAYAAPAIAYAAPVATSYSWDVRGAAPAATILLKK